MPLPISVRVPSARQTLAWLSEVPTAPPAPSSASTTPFAPGSARAVPSGSQIVAPVALLPPIRPALSIAVAVPVPSTRRPLLRLQAKACESKGEVEREPATSPCALMARADPYQPGSVHNGVVPVVADQTNARA